MASKREHLDGYVTLLEVVEQEDNQFVSTCSQLGVASCGDTIDEALDNLDEAITLYLNDLVETGNLEEVFQEKNIEIEHGPPPSDAVTNIQIRPRQTVKISQQLLPVAGIT